MYLWQNEKKESSWITSIISDLSCCSEKRPIIPDLLTLVRWVLLNAFDNLYLSLTLRVKIRKVLQVSTGMNSDVKSIYLSSQNGDNENFNPKRGNTDVIVSLADGRKYIASFFAYNNIDDLRLEHQLDGDFLHGSYFWDKNMILVEECSLKFIEPVVKNIIDEGNFEEAFRQL